MTESELQELLRDCPLLFHMAEEGSWPSIQARGLLSTTALLDLYGIEGADREAVEAGRRPATVPLHHPEHGRAAIRDNGSLNEKKLAGCLEDGLTPADWYRILNARVFFWLSRERLEKLLEARFYRDEGHDVLEVEAAPLVAAYRDRITLSPINSGATGRVAARRGHRTFSPIAAYPYAEWRPKRRAGGRVVELAVLGGVPDIARFTRRVLRMQGGEKEGVVWERAAGVGFPPRPG